MLFRYQDKEIRVTTEDGAVFTGIAEVFPSGYGLHEYGREEEGIQLDDVVLFKSEFRSIEELPEAAHEAADPRRFDDMMGALPLPGLCDPVRKSGVEGTAGKPCRRSEIKIGKSAAPIDRSEHVEVILWTEIMRIFG